jgi:predicted dinucleotide-utilizing enzyme
MLVFLVGVKAMGEIVIKLPEEVRETVHLHLPYEVVKEKVNELRKLERISKAMEILEKYKHSVEVEEISEEELYLQGD